MCSSYTITSAADTQIQATVTISVNAPSGGATLQVQSNGYIGNEFAPANPGQLPDAALNNLFIQALPAPPPQIIFRGSNVAQTTQTVYVGQQIALTIGPPPTGLTVNNRTWSGVNAGAAIAGWTPGQQPQIASPNNESFTYYWVNVGTSCQVTYTVTYAWTLDNGQSNSSSVTFSVLGPMNANVRTNVGNVQVLPVTPSGSISASTGTPQLLLGGVPVAGGQVGIKLLASASLPNGDAGSYSWVQLLNSDSVRLLNPTLLGAQRCTTFSDPNYFSNPACPQPELDNTYPYGVNFHNVSSTTVQNDTATDGPAIGGDKLGEVARSFIATMYLLWTPTPDSSCASKSTCVIPVPLGSLTWTWMGDAINTLSLSQGANGTRYVMTGCQTAGSNNFIPSSTYPVWNYKVINDGIYCKSE